MYCQRLLHVFLQSEDIGGLRQQPVSLQYGVLSTYYAERHAALKI